MKFVLLFVFAVINADGANEGHCRLNPHPSVEYRCILLGSAVGSRVCGAHEPAGTLVSPQCRTNYYSTGTLTYMQCLNGNWDYIAKCVPDCGRVTADGMELVIGGQRVRRGELPWHAGVYKKTWRPYQQICGGTLISANIVISAAHCFWSDLEKQLPASQFAVAVGKLHRPWDDMLDQAQKSDVKVLHVPARYQGAGAHNQDDIAVVVTAREFLFNTYIRPACLNFDYHFEVQQLYPGNQGMVAGWGLTAANGKASSVLQVVDLPYVDIRTCIRNSPPAFREYITTDKICAGTLEPNTALCKGDSGGGLVFSETNRGIERFYLRGVVSTAPTSNNACNTAVYTSFTSIMQHEHFIKQFWIESGEYHCKDGSFITATNYCDGARDCADGSDETGDACSTTTCSEYLFRCAYGACVDRGAICNNVRDCADGSDEDVDLCAKLSVNESVQTTTKYTPNEDVSESDVNKESSGGCEPIASILTSKPTGQKAWDKCIEYQEKYVFPCEGEALAGKLARVNHCYHNADELTLGETAAAKWEFPHMVLLGYKSEENNIDWQCGGSLISEKFVLTAAHCSSNRYSNVSYALIGAVKRSEESDSNRYGIKRIINHDSYRKPVKYHDIALLELDRAVPLDHSTVPACLHTGDAVDDSRASATGWGRTDLGSQSVPDTLKKVVLTKFTTSECSHEYPNYRLMPQGFDGNTQICYVGRDRKSTTTCQGDSGGPLQVKNKKIACMYTVIGVTSFGKGCNLVGIPDVYTRVSHYLPWIESIVWPN